MQEEPILTENPQRFVIMPIQHKDLYDMFEVAQSAFWVHQEVDLQQDIIDYQTKLNDGERYFLNNILAFFAASDGIVNENLAVNFMKEVQYPEARCFYGLQIAMENVHGIVYSLLIDTYITDRQEQHKYFNALTEIPCVKKKGNWAIKYISSPSFQERLVAFAVVEGILFSGSFCAIFWLKKRGLLPGLSFANDQISRDECFVEGTEVLTNRGFVDFRNLKPDDLIGQYTEDSKIEFVKPLRFIQNYISEDIFHFSNASLDFKVTKNHDLVFKNTKYNKLYKSKACESTFHGCGERHFPVAADFHLSKPGDSLSFFERFCVAVQADGSVLKQMNGDVRGKQGGYNVSLSLAKKHKIDRMHLILKSLGYEYKTRAKIGGTQTEFKVKAPIFDYKNFDWVLKKDLSYEWCKDFINEISKWDGHIGKDHILYCSTNKSCIDISQYIGTLAGYRTSIYTAEDHRKESYKTYYRLNFFGYDKKFVGIQHPNISYEPYSGNVYCVTVPSGMIITRYNENILISGNCAHAEFAAHLYKNHIVNKLPEDKVRAIIDEALQIEKEFITESLPVSLIGMNAGLMKQYLEYVSDNLLVMLGLEKVYHSKNPFPFMEQIALQNKTNFFEKRVAEYNKATSGQTAEKNELSFDTSLLD